MTLDKMSVDEMKIEKMTQSAKRRIHLCNVKVFVDTLVLKQQMLQWRFSLFQYSIEGATEKVNNST